MSLETLLTAHHRLRELASRWLAADVGHVTPEQRAALAAVVATVSHSITLLQPAEAAAEVAAPAPTVIAPAALSEGGDGHSDLPTAASATAVPAPPPPPPPPPRRPAASLALQGTSPSAPSPPPPPRSSASTPPRTTASPAPPPRAPTTTTTPSALAPAAKLLLGGDGHSELGGGGVPAAPCDDDFDDDDDEEEEEGGATPEQRQGTTRRRRRWSRGISGVQAMFASLSPSASPQGTWRLHSPPHQRRKVGGAPNA